MSELISKALSEGRFKLLDHEAYQLLESYGIPVPPYRLASTCDEVPGAVEAIGGPVAIKVVSPDIVHKSDVGGVILNVNTPSEAKEACARLMGNVKAYASYARIIGIVVQQMVPQGLEVIVGGVRDRVFGPVILFGLGGVLTEIYRDVSMRLAPIAEEDAFDMIRETKAYQLILGYRNITRRDIYSLVDIMVKFSRLFSENQSISEADLNPVIVLEQGKGSYVVDARFLLRPTAG